MDTEGTDGTQIREEGRFRPGGTQKKQLNAEGKGVDAFTCGESFLLFLSASSASLR
jgi:hypothetical protein